MSLALVPPPEEFMDIDEDDMELEGNWYWWEEGMRRDSRVGFWDLETLMRRVTLWGIIASQ